MNRILLKYICNEANEAEVIKLERRISSDPTTREYYQKIKDIYDNKNLDKTAFRKEKSWDVVKDKSFMDNSSKPKKKNILPLLNKLAASVNLFFSSGGSRKATLNKLLSHQGGEGIISSTKESFKAISSTPEHYKGIGIFYLTKIGKKTFSRSFGRNESLEFLPMSFRLTEPNSCQRYGKSVCITNHNRSY